LPQAQPGDPVAWQPAPETDHFPTPTLYWWQNEFLPQSYQECERETVAGTQTDAPPLCGQASDIPYAG